MSSRAKHPRCHACPHFWEVHSIALFSGTTQALFLNLEILLTSKRSPATEHVRLELLQRCHRFSDGGRILPSLKFLHNATRVHADRRDLIFEWILVLAVREETCLPIVTSTDITTDGLGLMLTVWDLSWLPFCVLATGTLPYTQVRAQACVNLPTLRDLTCSFDTLKQSSLL
ncbi:hypothetical protein EV424DRAFT_1382408 [Suillus variegatus]|nr:hypothetical protein EV424DRAFT_1382408 [Suillus variegatus]